MTIKSLKCLLRWVLPWAAILAAASISAYSGLLAKFAADDMMNLAKYASAGLQNIWWASFAFWGSAYRPVGGILYLSIYENFGLEPLPYRIVLHCILAANTALSYKVARLVCRSRLSAFLAASLTGFHVGLFNLHFETSVLYDVLCFFFYFAALLLYCKPAEGHHSRLNLLLAVLLYVCALQAKEMAVSLPVVIWLYQWLIVYRGRVRSSFDFAPMRRLFVLGTITVVFIVGRTTGPDALAFIPGYEPVFSVGRLAESLCAQAIQLLYLSEAISPGTFGLLWLGLFLAAVFGRSQASQWALLYILVTSLPIAFIRPIRGGANLYIVLFGYAVLFATMVTYTGRTLSRLTNRVPVPGSLVRVATSVFFWAWHSVYACSSAALLRPPWRESQELTWNMIEDVRRLGVGRQGRTAILNDPFEGWDTFFIIQLVHGLDEPAVVIENKLQKKLTFDELKRFDEVFTVTNGRLVRLR